MSECIHLYGKLNIDSTELVPCVSILSRSELRVPPSYLMIILPTLQMNFGCWSIHFPMGMLERAQNCNMIFLRQNT